MRLVAALATVALAAASLAACGSSGSGSESPGNGQGKSGSSSPRGASARGCLFDASGVAALRVASVSCGTGRRVALQWRRADGCRVPAGASRAACAVGPYRCSAVRADRGVAVSCALPGRTVAFIAR